MSKSTHEYNSSDSSSDSHSNKKKLNITDTHMMVSALANTEKLISSDKRWTKSDDKSDEHHKEHHESDKSDDENLDNYMTHTRPDIQPTIIQPTSNLPSSNLQNVGNQIQLDQKDDKKEPEETPEEKQLKKLDMLRKLCELAQAGCKLSQNYNMDSDYTTMKYEYEMHTGIRAKYNAIKWMQNLGLNLVYGLEMANEKYNPFDLKLKGWSEVMNTDIDSYYDIFGELYEKYQTPGKPIPPEIKLLFMVSASAIKIHLTHTMASQFSTPQDLLNKDPQLAEQLRQKAMVDRMVQQSKNQNNKFQEKLNTQYDEAVKKARDLQMLNEQKVLAQQMAQSQTPQTPPINQPVMTPPLIPPTLKNKFAESTPTTLSNMTNQQFMQIRNNDILQHKNELEQKFINEQLARNVPQNNTHIDSIREMASEQSKVSVNPKFDDIIGNITKESESIKSKPRRRNVKKVNT